MHDPKAEVQMQSAAQTAVPSSGVGLLVGLLGTLAALAGRRR